MSNRKSYWDRFFQACNALHLILAILVGIAGAFILGSLLGMGLPGYAIGFVLGIGIAFGAITFF